ncbi:hypothetical protein [Acanthopleuribacter pedis]|uniref:Uncharacterized protein n=1 Tax=Acanthopleuribacter pedis TaxID=442870 RepID=A0A8J7Q278_9BACT|nr:hypothetical protein [Acanthopleuribacter pedis]MBO1317925.1 hypothetical protein [Acanthopleuribacter pedis]
MKYWSLCCLLLGMSAFAQTDYVAPLRTLLENRSNVKTVLVVFNARNMDEIPVPETMGSTKVIKVGIKSVSDVSRNIVNDILKREPVQAMLLYDDGEKLVTNKRTVTYLMKQSKKFNLEIYSDSQAKSSRAIHGRVVRKGSQWELVYELGTDG